MVLPHLVHWCALLCLCRCTQFFPITERFQTKKKPKQSKPAYFASGNMPDLQRKINQEMAAAYDELMLS